MVDTYQTTTTKTAKVEIVKLKSPVRLVVYGGSRKASDNSAFLHASKNVIKDYQNDLPIKSFFINNGSRSVISALADQEDNGRQLRYIARYLKAWRDQEYKEAGGPSSILLMIIANQNYQYFENRDDLALLHVLKNLPKALIGPVKESSIPEHTDEDFNRIPEDERQDAHDLARELLGAVSVAIDIESPKTSISFLRSQFGKRIPDDESYVVVENSNQELPSQAISPATIEPTRGG